MEITDNTQIPAQECSESSFANYLAIELLDCRGCSNPSELMIQYTENTLRSMANTSNSHIHMLSQPTSIKT